MLVGALVAHHAHGADGGEEDGARLPDLVVERDLDFAVLHVGRNAGSQHTASLLAAEPHLVLTQATDVDVVGILEDAHLLGRDVAQDADGEARTREGMARDEVLGHTHRAAHAAHLVLEEPLQRLAELEVHLLGQAADVVVALDDLARDVETLDAVGIDRALSEPLRTRLLLGLGIEDLDEVAADDLALLLGVGDASEVGEELLGGIDADDVETETLVVLHDVAELILAEHAVIAQLCLEFGHGGLDEGVGTPVLLAAADINHEVAQQLATLERVEHLGVELHGPDGLLRGGIGGEAHVGRRGDALAVRGDGRDGVAMAHPHLRLGLETLEEGIAGLEVLQVGAAILATVGGLHLTPIGMGDKLCAVADAEHGNLADKLREIYLESLGVVDRIGRSREDDADDGGVVLGKLVVGQDLAEGVQLADAAADKLRGL